jgi:hypothetical protein
MESNVKDGKVWMSIEDFISEHEHLLKVLKEGPDYEDQKKELEEVKAQVKAEKKPKKDASTISMDALKSSLPEAPKPTFQGNLNAY